VVWQKGQSGNPHGRPKISGAEREARRLAQDHSTRAIERLAELMESDDHRAAIAACKVLLEQAFGRAPLAATIQHDMGADAPGPDLTRLTRAERIQLEQTLRKAMATDLGALDS
jgi:hypothetical protein